MQSGYPQIRAVVGGTGEFIAAAGQVTTKKNDDGTYLHMFKLLERNR